MLDKKDLEHLAELARIELAPQDEPKLLADLDKILAHFEELKEVNTDAIEPMAGGNLHRNVFRDETDYEVLPSAQAVEQFPESEKEFLKVPPVFE